MKRIFLFVLDSFGIGAMPDSEAFGDVGVNTLRSCAKSDKLNIPTMIAAGLGNIDGVDCLPETDTPIGAFARLQEASMGKDTTIGHWEISGLVSPEPLPTYPEGFPEEVLKAFEEGQWWLFLQQGQCSQVENIWAGRQMTPHPSGAAAHWHFEQMPFPPWRTFCELMVCGRTAHPGNVELKSKNCTPPPHTHTRASILGPPGTL